jgi:hypothetical protein
MNSLFDVVLLIGLVFPPISVAYIWWNWFRASANVLARWRKGVFIAGLSAVTANLVIFWSWVIYLASHRGHAGTWKVWDKMSDLALGLILFGIFASLFGKGRGRSLLAAAGVLSILPWIPVGV